MHLLTKVSTYVKWLGSNKEDRVTTWIKTSERDNLKNSFQPGKELIFGMNLRGVNKSIT